MLGWQYLSYSQIFEPGHVLLTPFGQDSFGKPQIGCDVESVYRYGMLIRKAEELLLRLFSQGLLSGTTHTCLGQELCAMSVVRALGHPQDAVFSNHRNHGHFLTYSGHFLGLVAEVMGRRAGVCAGVGGSQHLAYRRFHSNGVQGGMTAIGVGQAWAIKRRGEGGIVAVIVGDGTMGEGLVYESLNLASIWKLPYLFVVEDNRIAQSTPSVQTLGGSIADRGRAFGLPTWELNDADPLFLTAAENIVAELRRSGGPGFLVIQTRRLGPHSKGDDFRDSKELADIRIRDPLSRLGQQLSDAQREEIDAAAEEFLRQVHRQALDSPESTFNAVQRNIFTFVDHQVIRAIPETRQGGSVLDSLNRAMGNLLEDHPEVVVLGEDLHDPYGGAFKVTAGHSTRFQDRVISTPISEAGIVGAGIGLAMAGFRPIVEIMFADFVTLALDQIMNHAVKFPGMFVDSPVPLVIRTPCGGRRGYGPTHSQCPENLLAAVPGLTVVFPSHRHDPGTLLQRAVLGWNSPTFVLEHKLLYGQRVDSGGYRELLPDASDSGAEWFPTLRGGADDPDVTLVTYGHSVVLAEEAAAQLHAEEIETEIVIASLLSPLPAKTLVNHLNQRARIVVIEEAPAGFGFAAELGAVLLQHGFSGSFRRVAALPVPVPSARSLEATVLPTPQDVINAVIEMVLEQLPAHSS